MRPITRLNEHNLVLVRIVQRMGLVALDREVEHRHARLQDRVQVVVVPVVCRNELGAAEAELGAATSGNEDRRVVDSDGDDLLAGQNKSLVPERRRELSMAEEFGILCAYASES